MLQQPVTTRKAGSVSFAPRLGHIGATPTFPFCSYGLCLFFSPPEMTLFRRIGSERGSVEGSALLSEGGPAATQTLADQLRPKSIVFAILPPQPASQASPCPTSQRRVGRVSIHPDCQAICVGPRSFYRKRWRRRQLLRSWLRCQGGR